jgi:uncharacterized protein (DUF433 family)
MAVNQATSASWIEKNPGVCGGAPCIRSTRHTVAGLVLWRRLGVSDDRILEHHPDLNTTDLEAAWTYYRQQPEEIEQLMQEDEET